MNYVTYDVAGSDGVDKFCSADEVVGTSLQSKVRTLFPSFLWSDPS